MTRKFKELRAKMSPKSRARVEARTRAMMEELLLAQLRRRVGLTQEEVARKLGIKQPSLSKLESQGDMHVSTLRRLVEALGGTLEIVVRLPTGDIRIQQFEESG